VKVNIISIGNSKGIRIPKILLEQVHLNKEADLVVEGAKLVIRPVKKAREGWAKAFKSMHAKKEDTLLIEDSLDLEVKNWEW
jgi:antitoxin MazE